MGIFKACDSEVENFLKPADCWGEIDSVLIRYSNIMEKVKAEAVRAGHIHTAVENLCSFSAGFHDYAEKLAAEIPSSIYKHENAPENTEICLHNEVRL